MQRHWTPAFAGVTVFVPLAAEAHGFGRLYNLPVPFWLYAWSAAAVLVVSFALVGWFASAPLGAAPPASRDLTHSPLVAALRRARLRAVLQGVALLALLLSIVTGFLGSRDPYRNFSMTAFWVVFVLAFAYATALFGDLYAAINPWRTLSSGLGRLWRGYARGRIAYPGRLGDWPALALYLGFIWFELFGYGRPFQLASVLLGYTLLNLAGVWLVGAAAWFRHCEFFGLFLRLVALMAPIEFRPASGGQPSALRWRMPFAGLVQERPERLGTVVFALFMLSSTAFDGLKATQSWVFFFWHDYTGLLTAWLGKTPIQAYATVLPWYKVWETFWLLASPFVYFGVYALFIALAKALARSRRPLRELLLDFGYTLLPIALVYHVTHYFTLILTQGVKIVSLLSDPFGWGWNLFGTAQVFRAPILPDLGIVWHTQVALILLGHIVSVWIAHLVALRVFATRREAVLSQLPMLALMVLFTIAGLWILAQPLTSMLMR
jgi:hypothetical protein